MLTITDKFPKFSADAVVSLDKGSEFKTITSDDYAGKWKAKPYRFLVRNSEYVSKI